MPGFADMISSQTNGSYLYQNTLTAYSPFANWAPVPNPAALSRAVKTRAKQLLEWTKKFVLEQLALLLECPRQEPVAVRPRVRRRVCALSESWRVRGPP